MGINALINVISVLLVLGNARTVVSTVDVTGDVVSYVYHVRNHAPGGVSTIDVASCAVSHVIDQDVIDHAENHYHVVTSVLVYVENRVLLIVKNVIKRK